MNKDEMKFLDDISSYADGIFSTAVLLPKRLRLPLCGASKLVEWIVHRAKMSDENEDYFERDNANNVIKTLLKSLEKNLVDIVETD